MLHVFVPFAAQAYPAPPHIYPWAANASHLKKKKKTDLALCISHSIYNIVTNLPYLGGVCMTQYGKKWINLRKITVFFSNENLHFISCSEYFAKVKCT